jgi:hypothetical protein
MTTKTENFAKCRSCGAEIIWARTKKGKPIPLDRSPTMTRYVREGTSDLVVQRTTYQTHFITCPNAAEHRK